MLVIEIYVNDIRNALKNQSYFSALSLALTLPDICGMAEYPNKQVAERYIGWYNKYIGDYVKNEEPFNQSPYLSGEMVYNLRNTYLHQGSPNVDASKVKEEVNQVDKFILSLGDGTKIHEMTFSVNVGPVAFRTILVDITYLCGVLCDCSLAYYRENAEKFGFEFNIIPQGYLYGVHSPLDDVPRDGDPIGDIINKKLLATGNNVQIAGNLTQHMMSISAQALTGNVLPQNNQPHVEKKKENADTKLVVDKKPPTKKVIKPTPSKKELQFRSFFGQTFKEKEYKDKKGQIIEAFLTSKTKTQLNSKLTKLFQGADVKIILKRLQPKIKDWPGQ